MKLNLRWLAVVGASFVAVVAVFASTAAAASAPFGLCTETGASSDSGTQLSGSYKHLTVTGNAFVAGGDTLQVTGGLTLAPGSCLEAMAASSVTISGGVHVAPGAVFGLGYGGGSYTVNGGVVADHPGSVYIGGATVNGGFVSVGGGDPLRNFPIKDTTFNGGVSVAGWSGLWIGFLRNTVHGGLTIANNAAADPTMDPGSDSTEVADNHVFGNLSCFGNTPGAEVGDSGGGPNVVSGQALGECAGLV